MDQNELFHFRKKLRALAERVRTDAAETSREAQSGATGHAAGELSDMPTHPADRGTEEFLAEMNSVLLENEQYIVDEARAALERIDSGAFGQCENCGQPIGKERLEAIPYARFCIRCADKHAAPSPSLSGD